MDVFLEFWLRSQNLDVCFHVSGSEYWMSGCHNVFCWRIVKKKKKKASFFNSLPHCLFMWGMSPVLQCVWTFVCTGECRLLSRLSRKRILSFYLKQKMCVWWGWISTGVCIFVKKDQGTWKKKVCFLFIWWLIFTTWRLKAEREEKHTAEVKGTEEDKDGGIERCGRQVHRKKMQERLKMF